MFKKMKDGHQRGRQVRLMLRLESNLNWLTYTETFVLYYAAIVRNEACKRWTEYQYWNLKYLHWVESKTPERNSTTYFWTWRYRHIVVMSISYCCNIGNKLSIIKYACYFTLCNRRTADCRHKKHAHFENTIFI